MKKIILFFIFFGINLVAFSTTPKIMSGCELSFNNKQEKSVYKKSFKKIEDRTFYFYHGRDNHNLIKKDDTVISGSAVTILKENN